MEDNLGEIIYEALTENYKDKIDIHKDLQDYLKEQTKNELIHLYLIYGYAGNMQEIYEEITRLQNKKKEEAINKILKFLDVQIISILQFMNNKRITEMKQLAHEDGIYCFYKYETNNISFDTIKILKQLKFIFCRKEEGRILIHMPQFIKEKINSISGDFCLPYYDVITSYTQGLANTYGVIHIDDAYDIIKNDILINIDRYEFMIKFMSMLELELISYNFRYGCICNPNIGDEEVEELLLLDKNMIVYGRNFYEDMGTGRYLTGLKEYKQFRKYLIDEFNCDLDEDQEIRDDLISGYIDFTQIDKEEAMRYLNAGIDRNFEVDDADRARIISFVNKIGERMPVWKEGGAVNNVVQPKKIGRNDPCPCGSGKKYKNCCGRNI